jgi:thiol-disulfide isomerase/thioredoxin
MKTQTSVPFIRHLPTGLLAWFCLCFLLPQSHAGDVPAWTMKNYEPTNGDFSAVVDAVVELLQSRDTTRFAGELAPSIEDWQAILSTNADEREPDPLNGFRKSTGDRRQKVESSAKELLAKADALHLDFSKGHLHSKAVTPRFLGNRHFPSLQAENESLPSVQKLDIIVNLDSGTTNATNGEFKLAVHGLMKFPGGWRSDEGAQWTAFPSNVADGKTLRELAILEKATTYKGITDEEDPALLKLGEALVHFIRERDVNIYEQEALVTGDLTWAQMQKKSSQGPTRQEFDKEWNMHQQELVAAARSVTGQMDEAGIDFNHAEIQVKRASVEQLYPRMGSGTMDGLEGKQFLVKLAVKSEGKSKTGKSLSGDYILAADQITRFGNVWRVTGKARWEQLPAGVVDEKAAAALVFENYVAEHRTLPPGTAAPEIEFTRLDNRQKMKLSDLRGKVVVLDFWATWCGPCQEPLAKLQTIRQKHPDWKQQVAIVPLSIDDTLQQVRDHLQKRGWKNTFNVWAGDGGWASAPSKTFRVSGVPTTYIIDAQGKIVIAGHPAGLHIADVVNAFLKPAK